MDPANSTVIDSTDSFTRTAGKQLISMALLAIGGLILLMFLLGWASNLSRGSGETLNAVDPATGTITLVMAQEPPQLNSTLSTDQVSGQILGHVMEGLLRYDAHNELAPGVAERWEIRPDGATFWLRPDARWSDGEPVTADDFVFAWQVALDPANASEYAFILYPLKNGEAINNGELPREALGVTAPEPQRLEIQFERPIAYFDKLVAFSTYGPIRREFYNQHKGRYGADADDMLYNGPFAITRWVHGAHLRMEKNPYYWDKQRIRLNVIDIPYITSDTTATLNLFKDGKIVIAGLDAETLENALEQRWQINRFIDGSIFFLEFNHRPGRMTRNHNLRKALQLVSDPAELVYKVIKLPGNMPGVSLFPVWLKGVHGLFRQEYPPPELHIDFDEAKRYLELAKQDLGVDEIPPLVMLIGDSPTSKKQAEYFQSLYKRALGLDIKIDAQIFKQRLAKMTSGEFDLVAAGWGPDYDDPLTFGDLFSSWNKNNRGMYANPELDKWVRVAQSSLDKKTRMDAFGEIQQILFDDAVIILNYERGTVYVKDPRVGGVVRRAVGADPDFTNAYIKSDSEVAVK